MRQSYFRLGATGLTMLFVLLFSGQPVEGASSCNDVSWLNPSSPPPFLTDIDQAPGTGLCQFQEFSNWNFMSLVLGASPAFESWPTTEQVYPAQGQPICSGAPLGSAVTPSIRKTGAEMLELGHKPLEATGQPLVDRAGRYIQYEMRVNPTLCETVSACQLQIQACGDAAVKLKPADFRWPSGVSDSTVPGSGTPGAAEIKLAWRVMETCNLPDSPKPCTLTDLSKFFTISSVTVDSYSPTNPKSVSGVTLGLVGFHLMQKTPTRPEFMWATWEHVLNAPVCPRSHNSVCQAPSISTSGWSLYDPNTNPPPLVNSPPQCPDPTDSSTPPTQPNCLNQPYNKPPPPFQPPTEVCRLAPCGGGEAAKIAEINKAIRVKLGTSVWANYFFVGSVWGKNSEPTGPSNSVGSLWLANTTMETYFQTSATTKSQFNCFTCHQSQPSPRSKGLNLDFVHSLARATQTGACPIDVNTCVPTLTIAKPKN